MKGTELTDTKSIVELHKALNIVEEIEFLRFYIENWIKSCDSEMTSFLQFQFLGPSKYFRAATILACHKAFSSGNMNGKLLHSIAALELVHNMTLIVDDILDKSRYRRNRLTLHCKYGSLPALMAAGLVTAEAFRMVDRSPYCIKCLSELIARLGVAECLQWKLRRYPLGIEDWRNIAGEDTGTMFETCARLATGDDKLLYFGRLLGTLYHGCDDVGDVRGATALGGGGDDDLRDGILTLPMALALREPQVAVRFRRGSRNDLPKLLQSMSKVLPEAELFLDNLAKEAISEAKRVANNSKPLVTLVRFTRLLSNS